MFKGQGHKVRLTPGERLILAKLQKLETLMTQEQDDLAAAVTAITTVVNAGIAEIQSIATQISNNTGDAAAMETQATALNTLATNFSTALAAVTAAPAPAAAAAAAPAPAAAPSVASQASAGQ